MFKWYVIFLVSSVMSGWFSYPFTYPIITETVSRGELPQIDWSKLKPGSLSIVGDDDASSGGTSIRGSRPIESGDHRFDAVVMITGNRHQATGCVIKREGSYFILTSQHALEGNQKLTIMDAKGQEYRGKKILAAKSADVALIEIDSPKGNLATLQLATEVHKIAKPNDSLLVPGDGRSLNVIELGLGALIAIDPALLEIDIDAYPSLRGAPLYHSESGSVIGILAEASVAAMGKRKNSSSAPIGIMGRGAYSRDEADSVLYFGQRMDASFQWEPLDWSDFQTASSVVDLARKDLHQILQFVSGEQGYAGLTEIKEEEKRAREMLANPTLSKKDRLKAVAEIVRIAGGLTSRRLNTLIKAKRYYIHRQDMTELKGIVDEIKKKIIEVESDVELFGRRIGLNP
ncbi:MAG: hypothetical protein ACI9R3_004346 [Verrucomicrobiales bacterium]|jgi:hypothetical protein